MTIKVDLSDLTQKFIAASKLKKEVMRKALPIFVGYTPIRTGNARNKTRLKSDEIVADYPYAQRLDEGYSRQAPKGMTEPTIKDIARIVKDVLRRGLK